LRWGRRVCAACVQRGVLLRPLGDVIVIMPMLTTTAEEAERIGLVSRIVPAAELKAEAIKTAAKIAALSRPAVMMVKEAVNAAYETTLAEGLRLERRAFQSTFALEDRKEGMAAFAEKRKPIFRNK